MDLFKHISLDFDLRIAILLFPLENGRWIKTDLSLISKIARTVSGLSKVVTPSLHYNGVAGGYAATSLAITISPGLSAARSCRVVVLDNGMSAEGPYPGLPLGVGPQMSLKLSFQHANKHSPPEQWFSNFRAHLNHLEGS